MENEAGTQFYSFAARSFTPERTFRLGPDALLWEAGTRSGKLAYAEIGTVHIYTLSEPFGRGMQVCSPRSRSGTKLVLRSKHFGSWGKSEDRAATFGPFVRGLLGRLAGAAPEAHYFSGLPVGLYYVNLIAFVVLAVIFLANVAFALQASGKNSVAAIVSVFLLIWLTPSGWRNLRYGWPRHSSPQELSDKLPRPG